MLMTGRPSWSRSGRGKEERCGGGESPRTLSPPRISLHNVIGSSSLLSSWLCSILHRPAPSRSGLSLTPWVVCSLGSSQPLWVGGSERRYVEANAVPRPLFLPLLSHLPSHPLFLLPCFLLPHPQPPCRAPGQGSAVPTAGMRLGEQDCA